MKEYIHMLEKSSLFKGLTCAEIETLVSDGKCHIKSFLTDETVAFRGDPCNNLMIVLKGSFKAEMQDESGRVVKIEDFQPVSALAAGFLFSDKNSIPVDVISETESKLFIIPRDSLITMSQKDARVLTNFLNEISNKLSFLSKRLWLVSFKTIKQKLAHYLLAISTVKGKIVSEVILPKSIKELADFFGVARPSLSRVLAELDDEGVIHYEKSVVIIKNREMLLEMAAADE